VKKRVGKVDSAASIRPACGMGVMGGPFQSTGYVAAGFVAQKLLVRVLAVR
jgi:hypothetical protein